MWKVKPSVNGSKLETIQLLKNSLEGLVGKVPSILSLEVGINFSTRPIAYDLVLITTHKDRQALEEYQIHPEHKKVAELVNQWKEEGAVVDFEG